MAWHWKQRQIKKPRNPDYSLYERLKQRWLSDHPSARDEQITNAFRKLARRAGL